MDRATRAAVRRASPDAHAPDSGDYDNCTIRPELRPTSAHEQNPTFPVQVQRQRSAKAEVAPNHPADLREISRALNAQKLPSADTIDASPVYEIGAANFALLRVDHSEGARQTGCTRSG